MKIIAASDEAALRGLYTAGWDPPKELRDGVAAIIAAVRERGDVALVDYTRRFDSPEANIFDLRAAMPPLASLRDALPAQVARAIELARDRVAAFHSRQLTSDQRHVDADGTVSALLTRPLHAIGAYVPGGNATLPSSVIMSVVPARVAGVRRVVVATPPMRGGGVNPAVLFACALCGVDEVYAVGGAQAVAALAYGTASIPPVDKIVGPGNVWVTEAKRQVYGWCGIDGLAGPSEVLVVADAASNPEYVAGEMIAQAEHDPLARVAAVSTDRAILERVADLLAGNFALECGRGEIVSAVLASRAYLVHAANEDDVVEVIERFAPEHLSLQIAQPWPLVSQVTRAGAIFVGADTPVAAGDYVAGTNHVLPTSGAARFSSGLRTADFTRTMSLVENSAGRIAHDAPLIEAFADFEGLPAHARTARIRVATVRVPR